MIFQELAEYYITYDLNFSVKLEDFSSAKIKNRLREFVIYKCFHYIYL